MTYTPYIAKAIKNLPAEAKVIRKLCKELKNAGNPVVKVWDGEQMEITNTLTEVMEIAFNLDECHLITKQGNFILIIMGNGWDVISDYSLDILSFMNEKVDPAVEAYQLRHEQRGRFS